MCVRAYACVCMCLQFQHDGCTAVRLSHSKLITPTVSCSFVLVGILAVVEFATRSAARDLLQQLCYVLVQALCSLWALYIN